MSLIPDKPSTSSGAPPGQTLVGSTYPGKAPRDPLKPITTGPNAGMTAGDVYSGLLVTSYGANPHYEPAFSNNSTYGVEDPSKVNGRASKIEATQDMIAGAGNVLPIVYGGPVKLGPLIVGVVAAGDGNTLYLTGALSHGPISAIDKITLDDTDDADSLDIESRLGVPGQTVISKLVTAYAARGIVYSDTMPGVAYANISIGSRKKMSSFPRVTATLHGRTVLDMRTGTTAWSANPILCAGDFIKNTVYGIGGDYDVASFSTAASFCDDSIGGGPRCQIALAITQRQDSLSWLDLLATYAECRIYKRGGIWFAAPRRSRGATLTFNESNMVEKSVKIIRAPSRSLPTVSTVQFTDTTFAPWQTRPATVPSPEATAGTLPWRETSITLPGITRSGEAARKAVGRLNALHYGNIALQFMAFDEMLVANPGDVAYVSSALGLTNVLFEINEVTDQGFGRYGIAATTYDDRIFSGTAQPIIPPVDAGGFVPSLTPAAPTITFQGEELYQLQTGTWSTRLRFEWDPGPDVAALDHFALILNDVTDSANVFAVDSRDSSLTTFVSYAIQEGRKYQLSIAGISVLGIPSDTVSSGVITVLGKQLPPGNVPSLSGVEANANVYLRWEAAIDLDIYMYEVRRGAVGSTWEAKSGTVLSKLLALSMIAATQPPGVWEYAVKAIDSVGNYSPTQTTLNLTVSIDPDSTQLSYQFLTYTPTNMQDMGGSLTTINPTGLWADGADVPDNTVGTFNDSLKNRVIGYPTNAAASSFTTEQYDLGFLAVGKFSATGTYSMLDGPALDPTVVQTWIDTKANAGDAWTSSLSPVQQTARYVRVRLVCPATYVMRATKNWTISVVATVRTERGNVNVGAGGRATVTLQDRYVSWNSIVLTGGGTVPGVAVYDNVVVGLGVPNTFDVVYFTTANAPKAGPVSWAFGGFN